MILEVRVTDSTHIDMILSDILKRHENYDADDMGVLLDRTDLLVVDGPWNHYQSPSCADARAPQAARMVEQRGLN